MQESPKATDHLLSIDEVCSKYSTNLDTGLDTVDAIFRLERDGPNTFTPPKEKAWYWLLFKELTSGFALLLWFSGFASFVSYFLQKDIKSDEDVGLHLFTFRN